jgi:hypothetical protein
MVTNSAARKKIKRAPAMVASNRCLLRVDRCWASSTAGLRHKDITFIPGAAVIASGKGAASVKFGLPDWGS